MERYIEELKKYLKDNGLNENLAESPVMLELLKDEKDSYSAGNLDLYLHYNEDKKIITARAREKSIIGYSYNPGLELRIKQVGDLVLFEKLKKYKQNGVYPGIDAPFGEPYDVYGIKKVTYYLDKNGEMILAEEYRKKEKVNTEVKESDLYQDASTRTKFEINKENIENVLKSSDSKTTDMVCMLLEIDEKTKLQEENKKLEESLRKAYALIKEKEAKEGNEKTKKKRKIFNFGERE